MKLELSTVLRNKGIQLVNVREEDLDCFIEVERNSHYRYVKEHRDYFGEWNDDILKRAFSDKMKMEYFSKIEWKGIPVGFLSYDLKKSGIDSVFIRVIPKAQNKGIGKWFLNELKELSKQLKRPVFLVVIRSNPARNFYYKEGFRCYKKQDVFEYYQYDGTGIENSIRKVSK